MSQERQMLLMLKGSMSELEQEEQAQVKGYVKEIQQVLEKAGDLQHLVIGIASLEHAIEHGEDDE